MHKIDVANAVNTATSIFWSCMGFGSAIGSGAAVGGTHRLISIRGGTVPVARIGSAIAGTVVSFATFAYCRNLESGALQSSMAAIDAAKEHVDKGGLEE